MTRAGEKLYGDWERNLPPPSPGGGRALRFLITVIVIAVAVRVVASLV